MKKVNKLVLDNAKNLAIKLSSEEIRKRVLVLSAAAMSVSDLLDDGDLKLKHKNSLFKISSLDEIVEIADLYSDDIRVDVRVIFDGNTFFVPKSHEKFFVNPEIYLVVRMTQDAENIEPVGFIEASELPEVHSNTEYYEYDINILKPVSELKNAISKIEKKELIFSKDMHAKIEELAIAFLDGEISDSEKVFFVQHLMKCSFCREKLSEMNEFDNVVKQLNKYPDLLNDQTLDILTGALARAYSLPEAQPVFLPDEDEEELILGNTVTADFEIQNEETATELPIESNNIDNEEKPFLLEYEDDDESGVDPISQETLLELGSANILNSEETAGVELPETEMETQEISTDGNDNSLPIVETDKEQENVLTEIDSNETGIGSLDEEISPLTDNSQEAEAKGDDFLLDFADEEDAADEKVDFNTASSLEDSGNTAESFPQQNDNNPGDIPNAEDFELIDTENRNENISKSAEIEPEISSSVDVENEKEPEILEENEEINLDLLSNEGEEILEATDDTLNSNISDTEELLEEEPVNEHLLLLGDEPELLKEDESIDEIQLDKSEDLLISEEVSPAEMLNEPENKTVESDSLTESDLISSITEQENLPQDSEIPPQDNQENITEEDNQTENTAIKTDITETQNNQEEEMSPEMQAFWDEDLKNLLDASDDDEDSSVIKETQNITQEEQTAQIADEETSNQTTDATDAVDPEIQNLMDDDLMAMLMENDTPVSTENTEEETVSVPKQIAQKLSQPSDNGAINTLYDESKQPGDSENQITIEEPPVVKSAVNTTKKLAVSLFVFLILLAGGATTYFMKFGKSAPAVSDGDENTTDGGALFDFGAKSEETAEEPPVPQDINKSMTNVFSEQPTALTITKISWNVSDKLAQNDAFKNYLQVAGKNLQINLQNDLANTTEFAYNNRIHLNFQVTKNNEIKNLQVLDSSGSEQIDNVVLRSIKETLKYINAPNIKDVKGDYNLSLMINF